MKRPGEHTDTKQGTEPGHTHVREGQKATCTEGTGDRGRETACRKWESSESVWKRRSPKFNIRNWRCRGVNKVQRGSVTFAEATTGWL